MIVGSKVYLRIYIGTLNDLQVINILNWLLILDCNLIHLVVINIHFKRFIFVTKEKTTTLYGKILV